MPIVNNDGTMSDAFRLFTQKVSLNVALIGSGSPEGVIEARQYQVYIDSAGTTGSLLYIKRDPDISGDRSKGWVAV